MFGSQSPSARRRSVQNFTFVPTKNTSGQRSASRGRSYKDKSVPKLPNKNEALLRSFLRWGVQKFAHRDLAKASESLPALCQPHSPKAHLARPKVSNLAD